VQELVKRAEGSTRFAFDWRNRQIAHLDLDLNLGRGAHPLAPATRTKVENSLSALRDILNRIELEYCGTSTAYTHVFAAGDAETLLYVLRDGLQHQRDKYERLKRGEIDAKDLEPGEEI
ncbi:MAG TPA: hypothetical protein VMW51_08820, partial [Terriglobia bacterium]|nr:hypothetical protein [Terriglobia bacterium]